MSDYDDEPYIDVASLLKLLDGYCNKCGKNRGRTSKCGECGIVTIKRDLEDLQNQRRAYEIKRLEEKLPHWRVPLTLSDRKFMEGSE